MPAICVEMSAMTKRNQQHGQSSRFLSPRRFESLTWAVIAVIYGGWGLLTWFNAEVPAWVLLPAGAMLIAWHGSLQHETIHGHPTRNRRINSALGWPPLGLWMPYAIYRESHLLHHNNRQLTQPGADPESFYLTVEDWNRYGPVRRALHLGNQTLLGRLVIGPVLVIGGFLAGEVGRIGRGDFRHAGIWLRHGIGVAAILLWVEWVCGLPAWLYLIGFVYPGAALTLLRSYAEHRAAPDPADRTAVVRAGPLFGLLFLNNNLHVAHHARPTLPWYRLPEFNRRIGGDRQAARGAGLYSGYGALARRHLLRPIDNPVRRAAPPSFEQPQWR